MFFKKQIKFSNNYGSQYVDNIINFLGDYFTVSYKGRNDIEMDLTYYEFLIDGYNISFISEGMIGTFILGKSSIVRKIIEKVRKENPNLFECISL